MPPAAIFFDRDGTLVVDVPYNGVPDRVVPCPGACEAVARVRGAGVKMALVSNQSGVGRGLITLEQVLAVNQRVVDLLGDVGPWVLCPHTPEDACGCRKPAPGLIYQAAEALDVDLSRCVVIGDTTGDMGAARAAGARAVLVRSPNTTDDAGALADAVCGDLLQAVERALSME